MTTFIRLLSEKDKEAALLNTLRFGGDRVFEFDSTDFSLIPGSPFVYWIPVEIRSLYKMDAFDNESAGRCTRCGLGTLDDYRFIRLRWEVGHSLSSWVTYFHGGVFSRFYDCFPLVVEWKRHGGQVKAFVEEKVGSASRKVQGEDKYFSPGFVFPRRTRTFSPKFMACGGIFSTAGQAGFLPLEDIAAGIALLSSSICATLLTVSQGTTSQDEGGTNPQFEVGQVKRLPWPELSRDEKRRLEALSLRGWSLKRTLDTINESSPAFLLPARLRSRLSNFDPPAIDTELASIQAQIDHIAFSLYGFSDSDRAAALAEKVSPESEELAEVNVGEESDEETEPTVDATAGLLSWTVGIAFGRFDWRLATGKQTAPPEPGPFDPLPAKSPGMLPDGAEPFHAHAGVLVDDQGHPHDLARLVEEVLALVEVAVPDDVRRWLQRDFFAFHLQRYSKSRRKAPIYWPLSTTSGGFTLWVYYPSLTSQTLYTAINDFIEPKLKQVAADVATLRSKGSARTRDNEKQFEALQAFELELIELRDTLLRLAPLYKPDHEDGVQINAAPLWSLFRHKPWQKVLKDTWDKLEKGDYDWAHLAMNCWPDRVREKCKTDKSLAIAHGLEHLYVEPETKPKKARGRKKAGDAE